MRKNNIFKLLVIQLQIILLITSWLFCEYNFISGVSLIIITCTSAYLLYYKNRYGEINWFDIEIIFPFIFALYTLVYPTLYLGVNLIKAPLINVSVESVIKGTRLASSVLIAIYILLLLFDKNVQINKKVFSFNFKKNFKNFKLNSGFYILDFIALFVLLIQLKQINAVGGLGYLINYTSRISQGEILENSLFIQSFFIVYSCLVFSAYYNKVVVQKKNFLSVLVGIHRILFICVYFLSQLVLGNRRAIIYIGLFIILFILSLRENLKLKKKEIVFLMIFIVLGLLFGYLRNAIGENKVLNKDVFITDTFGEFVFPIQTLYYYMENPKILYGSSYLNVLFFIIPRSLWGNKPHSLANTFMMDMNTNMGYAFTPLTEAYLNFGALTVFIFPILVVLLLKLIKKLSAFDMVLYIVIFMQIININRGEFATSVIEITIMYIMFKLIIKINSKLNFKL